MTSLQPEQVPFSESAALATDHVAICVDCDPSNLTWEINWSYILCDFPRITTSTLQQAFREHSINFLERRVSTPLLDALYS